MTIMDISSRLTGISPFISVIRNIVSILSIVSKNRPDASENEGPSNGSLTRTVSKRLKKRAEIGWIFRRRLGIGGHAVAVWLPTRTVRSRCETEQEQKREHRS